MIKSLTGGIIGATVLTVAHEGFRKNLKNAPQMQKLGMQTIKKLAPNKAPKNNQDLYKLTMASDLISNSLFYAASGIFKRPFIGGLVLGACAGAGAVFIPKLTALNEEYSGKTTKTALMAFGYYFVAGALSGAIVTFLKSRK